MQSLNTQEYFGVGEDLEFASKWYGKSQGYLSNEKKRPHIEKMGLVWGKWAQLGGKWVQQGEMGTV